jgi:hypothetical protein
MICTADANYNNQTEGEELFLAVLMLWHCRFCSVEETFRIGKLLVKQSAWISTAQRRPWPATYNRTLTMPHPAGYGPTNTP